MKARTLVTGFGPFLDVTENPSAIIAQALDRPCQILEVSYDAAEDFIFHIDPESFDRLLLMGVAPGRKHLCAELFARNSYGSVEDIRGNTRNGLIQQDQPLLLGSTLFGDEILSEMLVHNPRIRMSLDAGCYLCNFTYFKALAAFPTKEVGFLHVPNFDSIILEDQLEAIHEMLELIEKCHLPLEECAGV